MRTSTKLGAAGLTGLMLAVAPVNVAAGNPTSPGLDVGEVCAFPTCAPHVDWDCLQPFFPIQHDKCDPNDTGCVIIE